MFRVKAITSAVLAALVGFAVTASASAADDVAQFYRGKRIKILIGSGPGGGYDTYSRLLARHMGKYIPGHPSIIGQNMNGAGSIVAANFMVNVAPKDGTIIGGLQRELPLVQIMGQSGPKFKAADLNWLGSLASEAGVCAITTRTGVKSFEDVFTHSYAMGGTGANTTEYFPALFNNLLAAKFKLVKGYPGTAEVHLALERGELDGVCQSWASFKELGHHMLSTGQIKPMVQVALKPDAEMTKRGVPMLAQFITPEHMAPGRTVDEVKTFFRITLAPETMGRPFAVAPGVPEARVKALRAAFVATTKDPKFLAEAKKLHRDVELVTGDEIQKIVADLAATPKVKLDELDSLIKFKGPTKEVKFKLLHDTGKVVKTKRKGREIVIDRGGKMASAKVSGSRTKVTINGKKAKRSKIMVGMTCTFVYYGPGTQAKQLICKN